jgi:hypothetical protein
MEFKTNKERLDYIKECADNYGVPLEMAKLAYSMLGDSEAQDGFISELEDLALQEDD